MKSPNGKTKRICELEIGERFRFWFAPVEVRRIENGRLWFGYPADENFRHYRGNDSVGAKSNQIVEIIENKVA